MAPIGALAIQFRGSARSATDNSKKFCNPEPIVPK